MRRALLSALLLVASAPAFAASREVDVELGWQGSSDPAFGLFSTGASLGSVGIRAGWAVHPRVALIAGWQHGTTGVDVGYEYDTTTSGGGIPAGGYQTALYSDTITFGAKADLEVKRWLHPYATVQGAGMRALVRLDDDSTDDENLTQIQRVGITGGAIGAAGVEFPIRLNASMALAPYVELGYGWYAPATFADLGTLQFSGFAGRAGAGLRF
jgi:hypothetical protein